ncbi:MAG: hypothetical protein ACK4NW_10720 [Roseinatronobacter sp.]
MHLTLIPQHALPGQPETTVHVAGDIVAIDAVPHDFSAVPEGGEGWIEGESPFLGPVRRVAGVLHCRVLVALGDTAADIQADDPAHWTLPEAEGFVVLPALRKPDPEMQA